MTPHEFLAKWRHVGLKERTNLYRNRCESRRSVPCRGIRGNLLQVQPDNVSLLRL